MNTPPRVPQALLAALCPVGDFREAVLGDLAEEHAERVGIEGPRAAGRWYWREASRAVPHAERAWLRSLRFPETARLIAIASGTLIFARIFQYLLMWLVVASWGTIADSPGILFAAWRDVVEFRPVTAGLVGAAGWLVPIVSGYVAARLDRRAPLAGAIGVGLLMAFELLIFAFVVLWVVPGVVLNHVVLLPSTWLARTVIGGMLYVVHREHALLRETATS